MNYFTTEQIQTYLRNHGSYPYWLNGLKKSISEQDYKILQAISRLSNRSYHRANNEKRKWKWDLFPYVLYSIWIKQNGLCAVTGMPLETTQGNKFLRNPWAASIDRLNSNRGYVKNNIRLVVHWYNNAKNTWDDKICLEAVHSWLSNINKQKLIETNSSNK